MAGLEALGKWRQMGRNRGREGNNRLDVAGGRRFPRNKRQQVRSCDVTYGAWKIDRDCVEQGMRIRRQKESYLLEARV